ncbi:hypothetical protein K6Y31_11105 [Motilimonas cestriensis]|uniref:DUF1254 domain-containing protein n=1 Tax=Motilimonas cestriensis TaxID=2742685 RepID=A0ABS8WA14_9GAMM|nr:hypothetical protein [Motilimonas cestriensis]MCE2595363.1 hypothetical protein [Motilimonas cestriensis]
MLWISIIILFALLLFVIAMTIKSLLSSPLFTQPERYFSLYKNNQPPRLTGFDQINCWAQNHYFFEDSQFLFHRAKHQVDCACWINEAESCYLIVCQFPTKQKIFFVQLFQHGHHYITANTHPGLIAPSLTQVDYTFLPLADIFQLWQYHQQHSQSQNAYIANMKTYRLLCRFIRKQHASYLALPWWKINYFKLLAFSKMNQTPPA